MKQSTRGGKRKNAGRKKGTNEPYLVRCHPKVIIDVRKYAKERSEEISKTESEKLKNQTP